MYIRLETYCPGQGGREERGKVRDCMHVHYIPGKKLIFLKKGMAKIAGLTGKSKLFSFSFIQVIRSGAIFIMVVPVVCNYVATLEYTLLDGLTT